MPTSRNLRTIQILEPNHTTNTNVAIAIQCLDSASLKSARKATTHRSSIRKIYQFVEESKIRNFVMRVDHDALLRAQIWIGVQVRDVAQGIVVQDQEPSLRSRDKSKIYSVLLSHLR